MKKSYYLLIILLCLLTGYSSFAQNQIFIKATDSTGTLIDGGSISNAHAKEIEAVGFSESDNACKTDPDLTGAPPCGAVTGPWNFGMTINNSVIALKRIFYSGSHLKSVDISIVKPGQTPYTYYTIHMERVFINSISESGTGEVPMFYIQLKPSKIKWSYKTQKPDGSVGSTATFGWDLTTSTPF